MKQTDLFNPELALTSADPARAAANGGGDYRPRKRLPQDECCPWPDCGGDTVSLNGAGGFICSACGRQYWKGASWQNYHDGPHGCGLYVDPAHGCGCGRPRDEGGCKNPLSACQDCPEEGCPSKALTRKEKP